MSRPPFEPTDEQRKDVSIAAGGGVPKVRIAATLGIDIKTLDKYFEAELSVIAAKRRMEVLRAMHEAALAGNVAAQKAYLALEPRLMEPPPAPEEEPVGKKEQAGRDAKTADKGTDWEEDLRPRTLQ